MKCYKLKFDSNQIYWISIIGFIAFCILLFLYWRRSNNFFLKLFNLKMKEGFTWPKNTVKDFLTFQQTVNPNTQFNMQMMQNQASEEEVNTLLDTGYWPWSQDTEYMYMDTVARNPIIKVDPAISMEIEKKIYNENAMEQLLSWNTKEGEFLLNGSLIENGTIRCTKDNLLEKKVHTGDNLWNGYKDYETNIIPNGDIPQEVNGFHFIKEPCNPCVALDNDYSCPFQISLENDTGVSAIWKKLWNL